MKNQANFSKMNNMKLAVFSWNLAGHSDYEHMEATRIMKSQIHGELPDIMIVGF